MARNVTLVAIGDKVSEKTELLIKYTYSERRYKYFMPSKFTNNFQRLIVDNKPHFVYFVDAETDEDYKLLRYDSFKEADCILLCYSIKSRSSYENLMNKWILEVRKLCPYTPVLLVGTGTEARNNKTRDSDYISFKEGENLKHLIGARAFVECSVEKKVGIDDVFIEAIRSAHGSNRFLM